MEKQTAVSWFVKEIQTRLTNDGEVNYVQLAKEAKAIEKAQMIEFAAQVSYGIGVSKDEMKKVAEQYYKKSYNK
jgi:hypothetical protein